MDLVDEIEGLLESKPGAHIKLGAPVLLYDTSWVRGFCGEILNRKLKFEWDSDVRADFEKNADNLETLDLMYRAGCRQLYIGAETYDPDTMRRLNKRYQVGPLIDASVFLLERGFRVVHQLLLGNPGDDGASYDKTFRIMKRLPLGIGHNVQVLRPHSGTEARLTAENHGLIPEAFDELHAMQTYVDTAVIGTGPLTRAQVDTWYRAFKYMRYYRQIKKRWQASPCLIDTIKLCVADILACYFYGMAKKT